MLIHHIFTLLHTHMARKLLVSSVVLVVLYYVLVELPSPTFIVHDKGVGMMTMTEN